MYKTIRWFVNGKRQVVETGLTLDQARSRRNNSLAHKFSPSGKLIYTTVYAEEY